MTHLAMREADDSGSPVIWGEHVSDEEDRAGAVAKHTGAQRNQTAVSDLGHSGAGVTESLRSLTPLTADSFIAARRRTADVDELQRRSL
jgi:hypothetical protein